MSDQNLIVGRKGDNDPPEEASNTLRSRAVARILDLVSEGPIKGLVGGKRGIYINEVSWENATGNINFDGLTADLRYGDATQQPIAGFSAVEREFGSGQTIRYGNVSGAPALTPEIQINDSLVDAVRVTIQVTALIHTQNDGDIKGNSVRIKIEVKNASTSYTTYVTDTISGKTNSPYERAYRILLPKDAGLTDMGAPFKIRVSRLTPDSEEIKDQNGTTLAHYTEIIDHKLSYPDTAYIGMTFDSKLFKDGIPTRQYLVDGLKMQVPSNYYPEGIAIENCMFLSEDFTTSTWAKTNIVTPVIGNNVVAPDGNTAAQALIPAATTSAHYLNLNSSSGLAGLPAAVDHVASVYVKQLDPACTGVDFTVYSYVSGVVYGQYNVTLNFATGLGTYSEANVVSNGGRNVGWGVEDVGDGWYRIWLAGYPSSSHSEILPRLILRTSAGQVFTGNGTTKYAAAWGFQVHKGTTPYQYLKNTTTAKVTGVSDERYYGTWDGTFKIAWTNNPAWVLYMLLTHPRIGMGQWIDETLVDKWTLYSLAKYCDELVPDGYDGMEPRFTYNGVIRNRDDAYTIIQNIASVFRGIIYWGAGSTLIAWDSPKDPSILVTPANVIDGMFDYKGVGWKARHSAALVKWNDPNNLYKDAVEVVEDQDLILKFGWKPIETAALGCTSRGQAYRWGKWILYTEKYETETVTYKASFDHMVKDGTAVMPGDIIKIADPSYAGIRNGGRIIRTVRNHLLQAGQFDTASWTKTAITVTPDVVTRNLAVFDQVFETAATGVHFVGQAITLAGSKVVAGEIHNASVLLSRPDLNDIPDVSLYVGSALGGQYSVVQFNMDTGVATLTESGMQASNVQATLVGGTGNARVWRLSFDFKAVSPAIGGDSLLLRVYSLDPGQNVSYTGNTAKSFYVAQAQVSNGSGALDYIDTAAATRHAVLIDAPVTISPTVAYTISAVLPSGAVEDRPVISLTGDRQLIQLASDFSEDPIPGAMWVTSSTEVEPRLFRVISLREQEKNIVEVTALYHNPNKFDQVERDLVFETPNFSAIDFGPLNPPTNLTSDEYLFFTVGGQVQSAVSISWSPPSSESRVVAYDLQYKAPGEDWKFHSTVSDVNVTIEGVNAGNYSFRVRSVGAFGSASPWQSLEDIELFGLTQKPPGITNFNMNAVGDQAYLTWDPIDDPIVGSFTVKVQNVVTGAIWGSGVVALSNIPRGSTHVYVPLRYGTYMIKAVSIAEEESASAAMVVSDVAGLGNFNATATVVAEPTFAGTKTNCSVVSGVLQTTGVSGVYPLEAIYECGTITDLTEVYSNRLTPTISANGQRGAYVMSTWGPLANVESLDGGAQDSWSVAVEYSTTRVDPTTAAPTDWTDWRPLIVGDSTARAYKFRLRLISYDTTVQVRVSSFQVVIDMPDRVDGRQGASVPATSGGLVVTYTNPFKVTPAVAVTVQNAQSADVVTLSGETRTGFTVKVTNAGSPVARTINWVAKGYGKA